MKSKLWRVATTFVAAAAVLGLVWAVTIPSLLRARISAGPQRASFPVGPPATLAFEPGAGPRFNTEAYSSIAENPLLRAADQPLSTF